MPGSPFDDPELAAAMAAAGVDLELMTGVGVVRDQALAVLREIAEAVADGRDDVAHDLIAAIEPDPERDDQAAVAHVIGVGLGLLDTWFTERQPAMPAVRAPRWTTPGRSAATDILAVARKGRAFAATDGLIRRHRGFTVLEGTALAVAGAVQAIAAQSGTAVVDAAADLLIDDAARASLPPRTRRPATPASFRGTGLRAADRAVLAEFAAWLQVQDEIAAPTPELEAGMFQQLLMLARSHDIDPLAASGIDPIIDLILNAEEHAGTELTDSALLALDDYVAFRLDTLDDTAPWEEAQQILQQLGDEHPVVESIAEAFEASRALPDAERIAALAATRVIAAIPAFLEWLGDGRATTVRGSLRRADVPDVAVILGIPSAPRVHSVSNLPALGAWWASLEDGAVIDVGGERVVPGDTGADWSAQAASLKLLETIAVSFISHLILADLASGQPIPDAARAGDAFAALARAIGSDVSDSPTDPTPRTRQTLEGMEQVGMLRRTENGRLEVPELLRATVGSALTITLAFVDDEGDD
ncbi:hypothetical protein [Microbacterium sp. KR10-403]|uniref:hypothetical protein n=1 Tax=Microbacterium sp. KR10-403 TaxID=3158581 RepID=UPI0032E3B280